MPHDVLSPRVQLPYTYLMAWFAMHCPSLIKLREEPPEDARIALPWFEESKWILNYVARIRKIIHFHNNYSLFWCFLTSRSPYMTRSSEMTELASLYWGMVLPNEASDHPIYCTTVGILSFWSLMCPVGSPDSLVTTNYTLATRTLC